MSSKTNNFRYNVTDQLPPLPITTNLTINQGDMVWWDSVNYTVTAITANTQIAVGSGTGGFLGVTEDTDPFKVYSETGYLRAVKVRRRGVFKMATSTGETYNPLDAVTGTSDPQTIIKSGATSSNRVGFVIVDPPSTPRATAATPAPEHVSGAAGVNVHVLIEPKFPTLLS